MLEVTPLKLALRQHYMTAESHFYIQKSFGKWRVLPTDKLENEHPKTYRGGYIARSFTTQRAAVDYLETVFDDLVPIMPIRRKRTCVYRTPGGYFSVRKLSEGWTIHPSDQCKLKYPTLCAALKQAHVEYTPLPTRTAALDMLATFIAADANTA